MTQPVNPFAAAVQQPQIEPAQQPAAVAAPAAPVNPFGPAVATTAGNAPSTATTFPAMTHPQYAVSGSVQQTAPSMFSGGQAASAPAPAAMDMSRVGAAPAPVVSEGRGAKLPDMYGRLVAIFPLNVTRVPRSPQYITAEQRAAGNVDQDRMTATVVVLDAGPGTQPGAGVIEFGGAPYSLPPTPHTDSAPLPYVRKGMWINQTRLISQLRDFLPLSPGGAPGAGIGRLAKTGPQGNDPWYLVTPTEAEIAVVNQYLAAVQSGAVPHPLA